MLDSAQTLRPANASSFTVGVASACRPEHHPVALDLKVA
jgi:hypothetical protein